MLGKTLPIGRARIAGMTAGRNAWRFIHANVTPAFYHAPDRPQREAPTLRGVLRGAEMNSRNFFKWAVVLGVAILIALVIGTVMGRSGWGEYSVAVSIGMATVQPVRYASSRLFPAGELT